MTERLPWFPCYPSKLLGALSAMKPTEGYVYWIVCLRIYEVRGPCQDTLDALARRTGYNRRIVSDALDRLFRSGKLVRGTGGITNPFAEEVMASGEARREKLIHAGRAGGVRAAEIRKQNQKPTPSPATASQQPPSSKSILREEERKKDTEAKASAPSGAPELPLESLVPKTAKYTDSTHELWGEGPLILSGLGLPEKKSRPMIGLWLKQTGGDAQAVLSAIQRARDHRVHGPVEWITRAIKTMRKSDERPGDNRTDSAPRSSSNGADAIIAGMGRVASRLRGAQPAAGPGVREIPRSLDASGHADADGDAGDRAARARG